MIKNMHFLMSCSRKHIGVYISFFASTLIIFSVYMVSVVIQNNTFKSNALITNSGLASGYYQQMLVYILNGIAILYFVFFLFKVPKDEGYELGLIARKQTRLNILLSRMAISVIFILMLVILQLITLSMPISLDNIMTAKEKLDWTLSFLIGNLFVCLISLSVFIFVATFFNQITTIVLGLVILLSFPLVSVAMYNANNSNLKTMDKYEKRELGFYVSGDITKAQATPTVQDSTLIYKGLNLKSAQYKVLNANSQDLIFMHDLEVYNHALKYKDTRKADGWNAFKTYFNLFSHNSNRSNYTYKEYGLKTIADVVNATSEDKAKKSVHFFKNVLNKNEVHTRFINFTPNYKIKDSLFISKQIKTINDYFVTHPSDAYNGIDLKFWYEMLNIYDLNDVSLDLIFHSPPLTEDDPHSPLFKYKYNKPAIYLKEGEYLDNGFIICEMMKQAHPNWAVNMPTAFDPAYQIALENEEVAVKSDKHDFYMTNKVWAEENKEYNNDTPFVFVIPIVAFGLLPFAIWSFLRKDIK